MKVNSSKTYRNFYQTKVYIHLVTVTEECMCNNKMIIPKFINKCLTKDTNSDVQLAVPVLRSVNKLTSRGELQRNLVNCRITFE